MSNLILYIAQSLNGRIARPDGGVDWLEPSPGEEPPDYGFDEFYASVGSTLQGYTTYRQVLDWGIEFPYKGKKNYVLTRDTRREETRDVTFIGRDHATFIRELKGRETSDIWLIGGGQVNTFALNERLLDEIRLFIMPIILPGGIELLEGIPEETRLTRSGFRTFDSGAVEIRYRVGNT